MQIIYCMNGMFRVLNLRILAGETWQSYESPFLVTGSLCDDPLSDHVEKITRHTLAVLLTNSLVSLAFISHEITYRASPEKKMVPSSSAKCKQSFLSMGRTWNLLKHCNCWPCLYLVGVRIMGMSSAVFCLPQPEYFLALTFQGFWCLQNKMFQSTGEFIPFPETCL